MHLDRYYDSIEVLLTKPIKTNAHFDRSADNPWVYFRYLQGYWALMPGDHL